MTIWNSREQAHVPPAIHLGATRASSVRKPRTAGLLEWHLCGSFILVLVTVLVVVALIRFPAVRPGWAWWPYVEPFIAPWIVVVIALSKRSHLRYVRVRQV
ncbi:hypothetical protein ACFWN1_29825 [Streptomyces sp. NPDC058459]|uniref:hypothetical protein n=1 Tax=Streptomyces sp. NPDC058459 TaxID=3346508 RepID=UPI00366108CE